MIFRTRSLPCLSHLLPTMHWRDIFYISGGRAQLRRRAVGKDVRQCERFHEASASARPHGTWPVFRPAQDYKQVHAAAKKNPTFSISQKITVLSSTHANTRRIITMHTLHNCLTQFITVYRRHLTYKQFVKEMKEISQKMYAHVGLRPHRCVWV